MPRLCQLLLLLALPASALAQEFGGMVPASGQFTPGATDLSMAILRNIFGESGGSAWVPTIGPAMGVLNSALLVVGSALFMYTAVIGTMHSAHDGEILGKKWSSIWVPARLAIAVVMLIPTASGFSAGQIALLWTASQGIGMANEIWQQAATSLTSGQGKVVAVRQLETNGFGPVLRQLLKAEICVAKLRQRAPGAQAGLTNAARFEAIDSSSRQGREGLTAYTSGYIAWGARVDGEVDGIRVAHDACGILELPTRNFVDRAQGDLSEAESGMIRAQSNGIVSSAAMLRPVAEAIVAAEEGPGANLDDAVADALTRAGKAYIANTQQESQALADRAYGFLTASIKGDLDAGNGWLTAGSWYYQMARINSEVAKSVQWVPSVKNIPLSNGYGGGGLSPQYDEWINAIALPELELRKPIVLGQSSGSFGNRQGGLAGAFNTGAASDSIVAYGMRKIGFDPASDQHPILQIKDTGDYLMGAVEGILIAAGVKDVVIELVKKFTPGGRIVEAAGGLMSKVKGSGIGSAAMESLSGALSSVGVLITGALAALFVVAIVMSLYIPLLPFIVWVGGVVGYFTTVFTYVCAVPIWMAAHMHPEGEGVAGRFGQQGYAILVDVLARPALMILGLIGSLVVLPPVLSILFGMFQNAAGSMQADSVSGFVSWAVLIGVYAFLCVTVVHKCVALIHIVPNRVPELLGLTRTAVIDEG